jgi:hypothetical protein
MGSPTSAPKIIPMSPDAKAAQDERMNAFLLEKERGVADQIQKILDEGNCIIDSPMEFSPQFGMRSKGIVIIAKERLEQK